MNIRDLPTPALLLDLDLFDANLRLMAEHVSRAGKILRPHAKAHKCVEIARRQIAAGAVGVCVATIDEAELMVRAGIPNVLLTSPVADPLKCVRAAELASELTVVVDHVEQVRLYASAATQADVRLDTLVDLDVGDHRTGVAPGKAAHTLVREILATPQLRFQGLQAYSVRASHLHEAEGRAAYSGRALEAARHTKTVLETDGVTVPLITGASTGSYEADAALPYVNELQAGSYALMDVAYARIGGIPFHHALTVLGTVVSANHPDRVTVDAGYKAFSTDRPFGPEPCVPGAHYDWAGDEFGFVYLDRLAAQLGDRIRFLPPHCDPTVNLYNQFYVCRHDEVLDVWPIMKRTSTPKAHYV